MASAPSNSSISLVREMALDVVSAAVQAAHSYAERVFNTARRAAGVALVSLDQDLNGRVQSGEVCSIVDVSEMGYLILKKKD